VQFRNQFAEQLPALLLRPVRRYRQRCIDEERGVYVHLRIGQCRSIGETDRRSFPRGGRHTGRAYGSVPVLRGFQRSSRRRGRFDGGAGWLQPAGLVGFAFRAGGGNGGEDIGLSRLFGHSSRPGQRRQQARQDGYAVACGYQGGGDRHPRRVVRHRRYFAERDKFLRPGGRLFAVRVRERYPNGCGSVHQRHRKHGAGGGGCGYRRQLYLSSVA